MALFRRYQPTEPKATPERRRSMVIGGTSDAETARAEPAGSAEIDSAPTSQAESEATGTNRRQPKGAPTPTRRDAERARKERINPTLSPKEARKQQVRANREARMRSMDERENTPERRLMRDVVDSRRGVAEYLLPAILLVLIASVSSQTNLVFTTVVTMAMYGFMLVVFFEIFLTWRRFKGLLRQRLPQGSTRGVLLSMVNRMIQIRRFRLPAPAVKRGETI